jgi:hypothetical protein
MQQVPGRGYHLIPTMSDRKTTMNHDFSDAEASEIGFQDHIFGHRWSEIFLVQVRATTCVMKVVSCALLNFLGRQVDSNANGCTTMRVPAVYLLKIKDIHLCEVNAFQRLMQHGLADLGIIPRYYGEIRHLDVRNISHISGNSLTTNIPQAPCFSSTSPIWK